MSDPKGKTPPTAESQTTIIVTLTEAAASNMDRMKKKLESAGLEVEQVLDFIGQIVGKGSPNDVEALGKIDGVASVEQSRTIQLPPPGSSIQ